LKSSTEVKEVIDKLIGMAKESKDLDDLQDISQMLYQYVKVYDFMLAKDKMDAMSGNMIIPTGEKKDGKNWDNGGCRLL